ncbi:MAG: AgmX/PglI C-terminal domain-containing protein [Bdellovibrionales bacterium]
MKSPIILRVFKGNQLKEVKQFDLEQVVIGHQADVQLDLDDPEISPIHCMIEFRPEGYFICDLGSEYGTLKNGQRILDEPLQSNDEIQLGQYRILFFSGVPKTKTVPVVPIPTIPLQKPEPVSAGLETVQSRPKIRENKNTQTNSKSSKKTFAPGAQIPELQTFLKPHKGGSVEVLVCWGDRIIEAFHYRRKSVVQVNTETENRILLPHGVLPRGFRLLEIGQGVRVNFPQSSQIELVNNQNKWTMPDLLQQGRVQPTSQNSFLQLEQNEVLHIGFKDSQLRLVIRYVPLTPVVPLIPPLMLSSGELMGVLVALAISILVFLAVSTSLPPEIPEEEQLTRIAQIVFDNKPQPVPPIPEQKPPQDEVVKTPPPPPKEEPQKVEALDKNQQQVKKGQGEVKTAQQNQRAGRASEVAPKPNTQNKPKKFTSVKQGGAVKIADKGGANANSQVKDVSKVGLFSAFGSGGVRKQLDQAYSGAGDILGTAGQATGTAGMGENRPGDDLGSKFKDTGAGGKGTAIQGISGINTKGRSTGMGTYGSAEGFGDKTTVAIEPGGAEESFVGSLDREQIRRVVRANLNQIQACYTRELNKLDRSRRSQLEGKVVLKWDIVERGAAKNVRVLSSSLNNKSIEDCMRSRLATWQFPEPPAGLVGEVTYPFLLKPIN